ncbi:hypothetical protein B1748_18680 [Paenibacillus sp. MY03]|uniref:Ig-like domain-containing protein n=1 Tax=Paenibacillus sp. MY03 TaxID=302980 RepID=UPI000B3D3D5C|nr:Ig-like domain-containing protein [Paenibacillus sp. MY03]OUS75162.1 hypothetical protein B1748_18680 [Paenibacillus sp. MY03]
MKVTRKLSILLAIALLLQIGLPAAGWTLNQSAVTAAPAGPVTVSLSPADNLTGVPLGANLILTFDEAVRAGASTSYISIYKSSNNSLVEAISATSGQVSISSNTVTINPSLASTNYRFELNTEYYVMIDAGAFLNVSNGAAYSGIQNATRWNFRTVVTEDTVRPTYVSRTPEGGTHAITTSLSVTFSEPVYAASGNIVLSSTDDMRYIPVTASSVTGSGTNTISIIPDGALMPSTTYTVTVAGDNFEDASGNTFAGMSWSFTTAAAPLNLASTDPFHPADNAILVPNDSNLTIRFDQAVQRSAGKSIEIRRVSDNAVVETIVANSSRVTLSEGNTVATIDPVSNLASSTAYYVIIEPGAFTRPSPNTSDWFYGISAATIWNFTTGYGNDVTPPGLTGVTPTFGGTASGTNTLLTLTFNEDVYPNTGNIEIRQYNGGTLFRSIPITSPRVTGGGTKQITVDPNKYISSSDPAKSFVNNTRYYVTIGNRAIRDGAGNFYAGISSTTGWTFTVTQDGTRPMLSSLTPANGATAVPVQSQFAALFDKPVMTGPGAITFNPASSSGSAASVTGSFSVDPANNKRILITPSQPLAANTNYYVNIEENAVLDLVGNSFVGILNTYQWTFQTIGGDTTPPTITRSEVGGSIIRLIYNEPLNAELKPSPASYYVTVAGAPRNVTAVKVEGNIVALTLASSVGSNQKVVLSYTKPATGLVQDMSGNQAATITNLEVSNGSTGTVPVVSSGTAYGNTVNLNFSESLFSVNTFAYTQFTVTVGGVSYSPTAIWHSGNIIQLTVNASITSNQPVYVSYTPNSYPLLGVSGNTVSAFSNYTVNGGNTGGGTVGDYFAPTVVNITANGTLVSVKYNEPLNSSTAPAIYQYSITADGSARTISNVIVAGDTVYLTLTSGVATTQQILVSYIATNATLRDYSGNSAASFTNITANSGTGTGTGQIGALRGAILKGRTLTLTFNETLNQVSVPSSSTFVVRINNLVRTISTVQVAGSAVILTLSSPANVGESATVSYLPTGVGLVTLGGQSVASFTNANVANQTTLLDNLTGDYEASDGGGIAIKYTGATTTTDISPAGVSASRYTVSNDKFIAAVTTARNAGLTSPRIVFKVPDHERAGIAAISLIALEMASKQGGDVTFGVEHKGATYEVPLKLLNFAKLSSSVGGNGVSSQLLITIDQGANDQTAALSKALNSSKAQIVEGPVHYETFVVNGSTKVALTDFSGYVGRSLKTTANIIESQSAAVWLDPVTGTLSYVPTIFKEESGGTRAIFKRKGNSSYALVKNTSSFSDLSTHWAKDTVQMMARKFIVEGHSTTKYEPDKSITRGEFATYIAKGLGLTGDRTAAAKFSDVNKDTVMGAYIGAASAAGIVNGVSASSFKPNSPITRQDMATMMMRAAKVAELTVTLPGSVDSYLQPFGDRGSISSYAKTNMAQAIYLGIINGKSSTRLSPTTNATRAEGAVMIQRLLEKADFLTP